MKANGPTSAIRNAKKLQMKQLKHNQKAAVAHLQIQRGATADQPSHDRSSTAADHQQTSHGIAMAQLQHTHSSTATDHLQTNHGAAMAPLQHKSGTLTKGLQWKLLSRKHCKSLMQTLLPSMM